MGKKRGAPSKEKSSRKTSVTQIRLLESEKTGFERAAELSGLTLSAWMRERLRRIARHELDEAGLPVPFLRKD